MTDRKKPSGKTKRGPKGRFLPGNREGPGRPKGSRNKTTLMIEALLEDEAQELTHAPAAGTEPDTARSKRRHKRKDRHRLTKRDRIVFVSEAEMAL